MADQQSRAKGFPENSSGRRLLVLRLSLKDFVQ
jgi:hypothetical protein